ncbi:MAG: phosphatidate cytidylyltransferase [Planctomycetaceae bacterium]
MSSVNPSLFWAIVSILIALTAGTLVRIVALRGAHRDLVQSRLASLKTWWVLAILLTLAIVAGKIGVAVMLAVAAVASLREFMRLVGHENIGSSTAAVVFLLVPLYYLSALFGGHKMLLQASPVACVVALGGLRSLLGLSPGYMRTTASLVWGLLLFVVCLSYVLFLFDVPIKLEPQVGRVGWVLYLVLLTETNDIMQAVTGRRFGKTKITPRVSPNKSLEGLLGGILSTVLLAVISAPWLTTFTEARSLLAGMLISLASGLMISLFGFLGDINMSAIKRDAGVKDGSTLLPGQGGMIDRIDSLTFTAPVFYYFVRFVMDASHE